MSSVTITDEWPSRSWTTFAAAPLASISDAIACRRSWKRMQSPPGFDTGALQHRNTRCPVRARRLRLRATARARDAFDQSEVGALGSCHEEPPRRHTSVADREGAGRRQQRDHNRCCDHPRHETKSYCKRQYRDIREATAD